MKEKFLLCEAYLKFSSQDKNISKIDRNQILFKSGKKEIEEFPFWIQDIWTMAFKSQFIQESSCVL